MTIRSRLIVSIAAIQTLFLITMVIATLIIGQQAASRRIQVQAGQKADLAALLFRDAASSRNVEAMRELAVDLVAGDALVSTTVFDGRGLILASARDGGPAPWHAVKDRRPIKVDGRVVGAVAVEISGDFLDGVLAGVYLKLGQVAALLVLLSAVASWMFGNLITRRLTVLRGSAEALALGDFGLRMNEEGAPEIIAVAKAMNAMAERLGGLYADIRRDLDSRKRMLASTFEHMNQGVAIFDAEGRLVEANNAFPGLIGLPPKVVTAGAHLNSLVDFHAEAGAYVGGDAEDSLEASCRCRNWSGPSLAFRLPFPDGRTIAVQRTRLPDGGFIAVHEDITRQLQDERRLRHAAKLTTLGRLATATAHELNQPLNVIRLSADNAAARLAADAASPEYLAEKLQRISAQTERAARIIDHMRVFGRMPTEEPTPFDLSEAVRSAAEFFGETARLSGLQLCLSLDPGLLVRGHPALIEQVVANVLSNAFAALAAAEVSSPAVSINAARRGDRIRVEFADNAGGVPPDVLPRIFEPFFTTKSVHEGTGLGLSISYGIVADMGGRLEVENRGEGAVFWFELEALSALTPNAEAAA